MATKRGHIKISTVLEHTVKYEYLETLLARSRRATVAIHWRAWFSHTLPGSHSTILSNTTTNYRRMACRASCLPAYPPPKINVFTNLRVGAIPTSIQHSKRIEGTKALTWTWYVQWSKAKERPWLMAKKSNTVRMRSSKFRRGILK